MKSLAAAAILAAAPFVISATEPLQLSPSSPWVLNYAEDRCELSRVFGSGDDRTELSLQSESPKQLDMAIAGKALGTFAQAVPARFLPVQVEPILGMPGRAGNGTPAIVWSNISLMRQSVLKALGEDVLKEEAKRGVRPRPIAPEVRAARLAERRQFITAATAIEVGVKRSRPVVLQTGSLLAPISELDHCVKDSLRAWGVDPNIEEKIARPVWPINPRGWFTSDDYPRSMALAGSQSQVHVRVLVDATGKPTHCTAISRFKDTQFNTVVCERLMKRARFAPAELADGTKVPSYYAQTVTFRMAS